MLACPTCQTLNPNTARSCLACGALLASADASGGAPRPGATRCAAGHPVDPIWESCPYCDRASRFPAASPEPARPARPAAPTRLEERERPRARGTSLQQNGAAEPQSTGRLVAVLAAPGIGAGGAVFPVREGKTTLGADPRSDVAIAGDAQVSGEHAVILFRDGVFRLSDRLSTNGSFINGLEVPAGGAVSLRDRDVIRLGGSQLVLLIIGNQKAGA